MNNLLAALKIDLGIVSDAYDSRLQDYLDQAAAEIKREGATTLDTTDLADAQLVIIYASWLWRKRDTGEGMPRMVRYALNNRVFSEKMKTEA